MDVEALKVKVCAEVDRLAGQLLHASHEIHAHPELNFEEHFAHDLLVDQLRSAGLDATPHAYGIDTAFEAAVGEKGFNVAVLCEYDALPGIGHACGHNVIATAGLGAGLAAALVAEQVGGRLRIMGTPAEEGGGGKIEMARRGAFKGVGAAMMVHPADADLISMDTIALQELQVRYHGKAAHAAAAPWEGRNALDAAVLGYINIAAMRQHIRPTERIHGIITKGGDKANIVPAEAAMEWIVRSTTIESLQPLKQRVLTSLESAASACACTIDHEWHGHTYADMIDNGPMVAAYVGNAARIGRTVVDPAAVGRRVVGSTDMGNISYLVPSIHPMIKVAGDGVAIHTLEFAEWAGSPDGDKAVLDGAKVMAMTIVDLWTSDDLREAARTAFDGRPASVDVL
ncbi:MAG: M20 family metallopeptidase [Ilumatobacteraceae bacterium]